MTPAEVAKLLENQSKARARHLERKTHAIGDPMPDLSRMRCMPLPIEFESVTIEVPLPPSWNRTFKVAAMPDGKGGFRGNAYKSKEAKAYATTVAKTCAVLGLSPFPATQMLRLSGEVRMERAGCDLDDRLKVLLDTLIGIVFVDDEQVSVIGDLVRVVDAKNPGVTVTFTPVPVDRYGKAVSQ